MTRVDSFQFGSIVINGRKYGRDALLFPDGTVRERKGGFWKFGSHAIKEADIEELVRAKPEVLVVGTGTNGKAKVTSEAEACAKEANIGLLSAPSAEAIKQLNQLIDEGKRVSALIHITC
ncbi:MAG: MTH938/NDUFAF3 family protein [Chloroflexota bacterium]|nr:MTH938/NDUFAF3 family protein [Chloroflexota bacterium]